MFNTPLAKYVLPVRRCISSLFLLFFSGFLFISCEQEHQDDFGITIIDPDLELELIASDPEIATPIGMAIDGNDDLYILESHTHTPAKDYSGPKYDKIKKSLDEDKDGIPDRWIVYADSIEDGMNLCFDRSNDLLLSTKTTITRYQDLDGDGISDHSTLLVEMVHPENPYDHAAILGVTVAHNGWIYFSRGNLGGAHWKIVGTDSSMVEGYGDGGNVMRCRSDGSQVEEIATGFWNPFDIKFSKNGRLFVTDNDPNSRGPNRLIEIVPGGDYGYKSLYGSSGIHPYLSWNGELPGTLPYAAPLGEAPCAALDAGYTHFGSDYQNAMLVNIWEESNIVRIPLTQDGSSLHGQPQLFVQGGSDFHPVALSVNSRGDLYITDWVLREYPIHGKGKIWRIKSTNSNNQRLTAERFINRFEEDNRSISELVSALTLKDVFEQSMARYYLAKRASQEELIPYLFDDNKELRLQVLLTFLKTDTVLNQKTLLRMLGDSDVEVQRMTLIYIGTKGVSDMRPELELALKQNKIPLVLFDTYLATISQLNPEFIKLKFEKTKRIAKSIPRKLPDNFIVDILKSTNISEDIKAVAYPYLVDFAGYQNLIAALFENSFSPALQEGLIYSVRYIPGNEFDDVLKSMVFDHRVEGQIRAMALMELGNRIDEYFAKLLPLLYDQNEVLQYAAFKVVCASTLLESHRDEVIKIIDTHGDKIFESSLSVWERCQNDIQKPGVDGEWIKTNNRKGNAKIGKLVFESNRTICSSCHKVNGWGGTFGPNLSGIGGSKSTSQLATAVLDPSKEISPEWQGWYLVDQDGVRHTGRQIDVNEGFTLLMNREGDFVKYENPVSYGAMDQSLMPDGLEHSMSPDEFNHLIEYLSTLK